jgi:hypothetical protein
MSPTDRLERAQRCLVPVSLALIVMPLLVGQARRRISQALEELEPLQLEHDQVQAEVVRLRTQLDGALEALHEAKGTQGSAEQEPKAEPKATPGSSLGSTPGPVEGGPGA